MQLKQVTIKNFRAIKKSTIVFHELTALVGENNSGKTAVLRALNSFFLFEYEEKDFKNEAHRFAPKTSTCIDLIFSDVPDRVTYNGLVDINGELRMVNCLILK